MKRPTRLNAHLLAAVMLLSSAIALGGIAIGAWIYGLRELKETDPDPLEERCPGFFALLHGRFFVDELYARSVVRLTAASGWLADWLDRYLWAGLVAICSYAVLGFAWLNKLIDEFLVNLGFDRSCASLRFAARVLSWFQNGQAQRYLRFLGLALIVFALAFIWGCRP